MRGNLLLALASVHWAGTIPACAGEPWINRVAISRIRDYPRVCGGTTPIRVAALGKVGLSPRVRGNLDCAVDNGESFGTIPACAGEPICAVPSVASVRDYPRVCGGTTFDQVVGLFGEGLSPRVRGNLKLDAKKLTVVGTIPACAGEPVRS